MCYMNQLPLSPKPLREWRLTLTALCILGMVLFAFPATSRSLTRSAIGPVSAHVEQYGSISRILSPDGRVREGANGTFDPKGYRMVLGPDSSPRFLLDQPGCTDNWDDRFPLNGADAEISAIAVAGAEI